MLKSKEDILEGVWLTEHMRELSKWWESLRGQNIAGSLEDKIRIVIETMIHIAQKDVKESNF